MRPVETMHTKDMLLFKAASESERLMGMARVGTWHCAFSSAGITTLKFLLEYIEWLLAEQLQPVRC